MQACQYQNFIKQQAIAPVVTIKQEIKEETTDDLFNNQIKNLLLSFIDDQNMPMDSNNTNERLSKLEELIRTKFLSKLKSKEELIKFVMRLCFNFIQTNIKHETRNNQKNSELSSFNSRKLLVLKYFHNVIPKEEFYALDTQKTKDAENKILSLVMPFRCLYRKDSQTKTMNQSFLQKIFLCPEFNAEFSNFLKNFDYLANKANKNKISQTIPKLKALIVTNSYEEFKKIRCFPWSSSQLIQAKEFATSLAQSYQSLEINNDTLHPVQKKQCF